MKKKIVTFLLTIIAPLLFLGLWFVLTKVVDNQVILPSISAVLDVLIHPTRDLISMGSLVQNVLVSLIRVLLGYCLAAAFAIPLGMIMGYFSKAFVFLNSFLSLFRPIPPLAWVPLVMAWFGVASLAGLFGVEEGLTYVWLNNIQFAMLFIIFTGAFFPILTSTIHGVRGVNVAFIDSAKVLGASETQIFCYVILPSSMPAIINGLRIGLGIAWMCLVSAEMLPGSLAGIGYMITHAFTLASTDIVIAGMVSIGIVGALMDALFRRIEQGKYSWHRQVKS